MTSGSWTAVPRASWLKPFAHSRDRGRGGHSSTGVLRDELKRDRVRQRPDRPGRSPIGADRRARVGWTARSGWMGAVSARSSRVVILGGGPGGYEAALVAAHLGAEVTVVERDGLGGAAVLTDCVPSKTLISTADYMSDFETAARARRAPRGRRGRRGRGCRGRPARGQRAGPRPGRRPERRHRQPASAEVGVRVLAGRGACSTSATTVRAETADGVRDARRRRRARRHRRHARGSWTPRRPDGERILTWQQIYDLDELPERLVVVGSGVTGAELAQAYLGLGSRGRAGLLARPGAARRGRRRRHGHRGRLHASAAWRCSAARGWPPSSAPPTASSCALEDGREVAGSHALLAVGLGAAHRAASGSRRSASSSRHPGTSQVDRVSRTSVRGVYAAGDCTGVLPLASVAAMQGRIAMSHALGDAVAPLNLRGVSRQHLHRPRDRHGRRRPRRTSTTRSVDAEVARCCRSPRNPRAKMQGITRRLRQAVRAQGLRHRGRRRGRRAAGLRADLPGRPRGAAPAHRRPGGQRRSRSTRRCPARSPRRPAGCTPPTDRTRTGGVTVKKVRAAAVIAVVTTAVSQARDYAREQPRPGRPEPRQGRGLPARQDGAEARRRSSTRWSAGAAAGARAAAPVADTAAAAAAASHRRRQSGLTDPDPDTIRAARAARLPRPGGAEPVAGHQ